MSQNIRSFLHKFSQLFLFSILVFSAGQLSAVLCVKCKQNEAHESTALAQAFEAQDRHSVWRPLERASLHTLPGSHACCKACLFEQCPYQTDVCPMCPEGRDCPVRFAQVPLHTFAGVSTDFLDVNRDGSMGAQNFGTPEVTTFPRVVRMLDQVLPTGGGPKRRRCTNTSLQLVIFDGREGDSDEQLTAAFGLALGFFPNALVLKTNFPAEDDEFSDSGSTDPQSPTSEYEADDESEEKGPEAKRRRVAPEDPVVCPVVQSNPREIVRAPSVPTS